MTDRSIERREPVKPAKFAHVVLRAKDLDTTVRWYKTVLHAETVFANEVMCFLTYDDEHHRLAIGQTPVQDTPKPGAPGVDHFAYTYPTLGDLLHTYQRLKDAGITPAWCVNHGPTTSMYYDDPDGTRVELQYDNFESEAELKGWFETGAFKKNPIGVEYDPDKLVAKFLAGVPLEELIQQGSA